MYMFKTSNSSFIVGVVYVHQLDWPNYVTELKTINEARGDMGVWYINNKERKLLMGEEWHSPHFTELKPEPYQTIDL